MNVTLAHIWSIPKAYKSWKRLDTAGKEFVLFEVADLVTEASVTAAIKKWKKQQRVVGGQKRH